MEDGISSDDAGEDEAGSDQKNRETVSDCQNTAFQKRYFRNYYRYRCRAGRRIGRSVDFGKGRVKKPIRRLWISSVTDRAIKDGFAHLKNGHDYDRLYEAAKARAEADWLVGLNATRALTVKYNAQLSCGRVQTPTLAIIEKYYERIKNFKPQKYYGIEAVSGKMMFVWL